MRLKEGTFLIRVKADKVAFLICESGWYLQKSLQIFCNNAKKATLDS